MYIPRHIAYVSNAKRPMWWSPVFLSVSQSFVPRFCDVTRRKDEQERGRPPPHAQLVSRVEVVRNDLGICRSAVIRLGFLLFGARPLGWERRNMVHTLWRQYGHPADRESGSGVTFEDEVEEKIQDQRDGSGVNFWMSLAIIKFDGTWFHRGPLTRSKYETNWARKKVKDWFVAPSPKSELVRGRPDLGANRKSKVYRMVVTAKASQSARLNLELLGPHASFTSVSFIL